MSRGNLFVVSAPSGAGKTSLVKAVSLLDDKIKVSISHTTRAKRVTENEGEHYFFISQTEFDQLVKQQAFLEYANVYGNYYGTSIKWVETTLDLGCDVILEIDYQGALQIRQQIAQSCLIYILPPNLDVLKERLLNRNTDNSAIIKDRLNQAVHDIQQAPKFDFTIINDNFNIALQQLYSIITVYRLRTTRVLGCYNYK
jgi:guanylate kinase